MDLPERLRALLDHAKHGDRSLALTLHALIIAADGQGCSDFNQAAIIYRDDHLAAMRADGRDAEREAGRLSPDEVRKHLSASVLPRLVSEGVIILPQSGLNAPDARIQITEPYWRDIQTVRRKLATTLRQTGEHLTPTKDFGAIGAAPARRKRAAAKASVLEASGLVKIYRRRKVVNDVALRLQQGEIVGLLC